jgi:hypothetical protein
MAPSAGPINLFPAALTNISSSRHRPPSQATRKEGWTEVWGAKVYGDTKSNGDVNSAQHSSSRYTTILPDGCDGIGGRAADPHTKDVSDGSQLMKLIQHRPAWLEQTIMRMCHVPHIVQNSSYSAAESTGALPYLLDLRFEQSSTDDDVSSLIGDTPRWSKTLNQMENPVLIGRSQPGGLGSCFYNQSKERSESSNTISPDLLPSGSHIVDYLRLSHPDVSNRMIFDHQDMLPYVTLIQEKLNYILLAMRYGNDPAWEMVYKPQCVQASLDPNASKRSGAKSYFSFWTWYQAYSERALSLHNLLPSTASMHPSTHNGLALELFSYNDHRCRSSDANNDKMHQHHTFSSHLPSYSGVGGGDTGRVNVYRAMEYADAYYTTLEKKLSALSESMYFFGTDKPSFVDAVLFAHLAEAICDVHLVLVLANHSRLVKYFQTIHDAFFGSDYIKLFAERNTNWIRENNHVNARNAFNQIPESIPSKTTLTAEQVSEMTNAIQLMQQLAVHCHQLDEALQDAAKSRSESEQVGLDNCHRPMGSTLYKFCMGFWEGDAKNPKKDKVGEDKNDESNQDDMNSKWKDHMERMERDKRSSDETWVIGVFVAIFATVLISASSKTK